MTIQYFPNVHPSDRERQCTKTIILRFNAGKVFQLKLVVAQFRAKKWFARAPLIHFRFKTTNPYSTVSMPNTANNEQPIMYRSLAI